MAGGINIDFLTASAYAAASNEYNIAIIDENGKVSSSGDLVINSSGEFVFSANVNIGNDLIITGDLTVNGTTTSVNTATLEIEDPLIKLGESNAADILDLGVYWQYNDGTEKFGGIFRDATDGSINFFEELEVEPTTTVNTGGTGYVLAALNALSFNGVALSDSGSAGDYLDATGAYVTIPVVTYGTNNQIPIMNAGGTDFEYDAGFTYDGSRLVVRGSGGVGTVSLGDGAQAGETNAIAIGLNADVNESYGISIGVNTASDSSAIAIGRDASATGSRSLAIGRNMRASNSGSIMLGYHNSVSQTNSISDSFELSWDGVTGFKVGNTYGTGITVNADPDTNLADAVDGVIAYDSTDHEFRAYIDGGWTTLGGGGGSFGSDNQIPIMNAGGTDFEYSSNFTYEDGVRLIANGAAGNSVAIGANSSASNSNTVSIGSSASAGAINSVAVGPLSIVSDSYGIAIGSGAQATETACVAIGRDSISDDGGSVTIGWNSSVVGSNGGVAIGADAIISGAASSGVSIGEDATISGSGASIAIGNAAESSGTGGIAIGPSAIVSNFYGVALGTNTSVIGGGGGLALGRNMESNASAALMIGYDVSTTRTNALSNSFEVNIGGDTVLKVGANYGTGMVVDVDPDTNLTDAVDGVIAYDSTDDEFRAYINGAWSSLSEIESGTYSAVATIVSNLDSTPVVTQESYVRTGNHVTVHGSVSFNPTADATNTNFTMTLPITTTFTHASQASGNLKGDVAVSGYEGIQAGVSEGDEVLISFTSTSTGSDTLHFWLTYEVL